MQDLKLTSSQSLFTTSVGVRPTMTTNIYKSGGMTSNSRMMRPVVAAVSKSSNQNAIGNSFQRSNRFDASGISMSMAPQGKNNNDFVMPAPQKIESGSVMQSMRSRSSHGHQVNSFKSSNVKNTFVAAAGPFKGRSGSVEMSQKNFMSKNAAMNNMEQMKNMY